MRLYGSYPSILPESQSRYILSIPYPLFATQELHDELDSDVPTYCTCWRYNHYIVYIMIVACFGPKKGPRMGPILGPKRAKSGPKGGLKRVQKWVQKGLKRGPKRVIIWVQPWISCYIPHIRGVIAKRGSQNGTLFWSKRY